MPYAKNLEDTVVPKADTVLKAVQKVMKFNWNFDRKFYLSFIYFIFELMIFMQNN
jgi:hypothetical protein